MAATAEVVRTRKVRVVVVCEGTSPLLMNQMGRETLEALRQPSLRKPINTEWTPQEEAASRLYRNGESARTGIPVVCLFASLREAGRQVPFKAKTKVSTKETTLLFSFLKIEEDFLEFPSDMSKSWHVDQRPGRNPNNGAAVCLTRPMFDHWGFACTIEVDTDRASLELVRKLFDEAGASQGIGDFRPNRRGPYGCFAVREWKVLP